MQSGVLGHCTWAMLARRETLAIFVNVYKHIYDNPPQTQKSMSAACIRELRILRDILPLLSVDLSSPWFGTVFSSDASEYGIGVTSRKVNTDLIREAGSISEKWRFLSLQCGG